MNAQGERFANDALAYDQFGKIMREVDPATGSMPNATAWLIFHHHYWTKFGIFGATPGGEVPGYLHRADTLSDLAARIGVDHVGLRRTVDRFNPEAARARDPQFNRGDTVSDRYFGVFNPRLGRGTVGGPRTDALGRALDTDGKVIPGLYAVGNAGGAPTKGFYGGAGGTISLGLVFGYLAGREAASRVDAPQMY